MYSFHSMEAPKSSGAIPKQSSCQKVRIFIRLVAHIFTCTKILKFFFWNDLSNPISTDLRSEIDVSFIIATH